MHAVYSPPCPNLYVETVSDVLSKRICSLDTSASSALGVLWR